MRLCRDGGFGDREDGGARKGGIYTAGQGRGNSCVGIREGKISSASSVALAGCGEEVLYGACCNILLGPGLFRFVCVD